MVHSHSSYYHESSGQLFLAIETYCTQHLMSTAVHLGVKDIFSVRYFPLELAASLLILFAHLTVHIGQMLALRCQLTNNELIHLSIEGNDSSTSRIWFQEKVAV